MDKIKVALVDDHTLLRNALSTLIDGFESCKVILQVGNGLELIEQVKLGVMPDVILLDLNMPILGGYETAKQLQTDFQEIKVLMLTMYDSEQALIRLLQAGVKGFLKKDIHPSELKYAIQSVMSSGYYYSHQTSGKLASFFRAQRNNSSQLQKVMLTDDEIRFLKLSCAEATYKEIAMEMNYNPRAIDSLREHLFDKLDVKSRVGLAMYAIRHGIVGL